MDILIRFFVQSEFWIYLCLIILGLFTFRKILLAWKENRNALFNLEREIAQKRLFNALSALILIMFFGLAEFTIISFVSTSIPGINQNTTPTVNLIGTQTPNYLEGTQISATLESETVLPPNTQTGCIENQIEWLSPTEGDTISGSVDLQGTVNVQSLGWYRFDYQSVGQDSWEVIAINNQPVVEGPLGGTWNTSSRPAGDYLLRLAVYDNQNSLISTCIITVYVQTP